MVVMGWGWGVLGELVLCCAGARGWRGRWGHLERAKPAGERWVRKHPREVGLQLVGARHGVSPNRGVEVRVLIDAAGARYSLPSIIFVIVLMTTIGAKLKQTAVVQHSPALENRLRLLILFVGLGAISWLTMARIVRGQVLSLRTRPFVARCRRAFDSS